MNALQKFDIFLFFLYLIFYGPIRDSLSRTLTKVGIE